LRAPGTDFTNQIEQTYTTTSTLAISDNQINDLAVQPMRLLISTALGVDFISKPSTGSQHISSRTLESGSNSCQLTNVNEGYWTVINSGVEANYDLISTTGIGIINVDFEYNNTNSVPLLPSADVNDIAVVAGTPNLLNFATTSGDFVVEEQQGSEASSQTKTLSSEDIVSADFSQDATFDSTGTKYVTTTGIVTVFGMVNSTVSGTHHQEISLADKFIKENTRDQALITGTITTIRTTSVA